MLSCTPWCLDWLCSMCKKQPFLLRVLSSDPFNFCVRWATTRQQTGQSHGTGRDTAPHAHRIQSSWHARALISAATTFAARGWRRLGRRQLGQRRLGRQRRLRLGASGRQCAEVWRRECCSCVPTVRRRTDRRPRSLVGLNPPEVATSSDPPSTHSRHLHRHRLFRSLGKGCWHVADPPGAFRARKGFCCAGVSLVV